MEHRRLGGTGLTVSVAGLGCNNFGWRIDRERATEVVAAAIDSGITLFDTADNYGGGAGYGTSEDFLGSALVGRRDEVVVATKFGMVLPGQTGPLPGHEGKGSRRYIRAAVEGSLRRLRTDRIDLYQFHQPDPSTPIEETLGVLEDLVREGKILYIGAGGRQMQAWQFADAWWTATHRGLPRYATAQIEWSLLERRNERDSITACERFGISVIPFFPLAAGLLTGKYASGIPEGSRLGEPNYQAMFNERNRDRVARLGALAADSGVTLLELALGWLASRRIVGSVISGATGPEQVVANAAAIAYRPSAEVLTRVDEITLDD